MLSEQECYKALKDMDNGKTPGSGCQVNYIKSSEKILSRTLLLASTMAFTNGSYQFAKEEVLLLLCQKRQADKPS